jgi:thioredoxin-dependent peroxiredoxin
MQNGHFGDAYGTHIKELRGEERSIFFVDRNGIVRYAEHVPEISRHPDYEAALSAANSLLERSVDDA